MLVFKGKLTLFVLKKITMKNVEFLQEKLIKCEKLENKIKIACSFNNLKCNFKQGRILTLKNTNISFIEPHKIEIIVEDKKLILIYFNEENLFLYNKTMPINIKQLDSLFKKIKDRAL